MQIAVQPDKDHESRADRLLHELVLDTEQLQHECGQQFEVERDRDDVGEREQYLGYALQPLQRICNSAGNCLRIAEILDVANVVAHRGANRVSERYDGEHGNECPVPDGVTQQRRHHEEAAADDRRQRRDRGLPCARQAHRRAEQCGKNREHYGRDQPIGDPPECRDRIRRKRCHARNDTPQLLTRISMLDQLICRLPRTVAYSAPDQRIASAHPPGRSDALSPTLALATADAFFEDLPRWTTRHAIQLWRPGPTRWSGCAIAPTSSSSSSRA